MVVKWISLNTPNLGADVEIEIEIENATQQEPDVSSPLQVRYPPQTGSRVRFELFNSAHYRLPFGDAMEDPRAAGVRDVLRGGNWQLV